METAGQVVLNLIILFSCLLGIPILIAKFLDEVWLRDEQKRQLRAKFESWWLTVADYDRLKFALVCTQAFNRFTDVLFGEKLFSKKAFYRCSVIASGLLIASLAITGLFNHKILGVMPWANYRDSCKVINDYADFIVGTGLPKNGVITNADVSFSQLTINSRDRYVDLMPAYMGALTVHSSETNPKALHGNFLVEFYFTQFTPDTNTLSQIQIWSNNVASIRNGVEKYNTPKHVAFYTVGYYLVLFVANALLCFGSLVICRKVLREICATGRVISTISLLISNFVVLFIGASILLILLVFLSVPVCWLLLPFVGMVARASIVIFAVCVFALSCELWIANLIPLNLMAVTAFLPFFFSLFATVFSAITLLGRNWIHSFVSAVLLRCAEKSPLLVIGSGFGTIAAIIAILEKVIRGTIYHL